MKSLLTTLVFGTLAGIGMMTLGCPTAPPSGGDPVGGDPLEFTQADASRGGQLYDKFWVVAGVAEPTTNHPLWAMQTTNTRSGSTTWRCKECHGWDYKGAVGAYNQSNSHFTGFTGIFGTALNAQAVFDKLAEPDNHDFLSTGMAEADLWDLAKLVLEGQTDTDNLIDMTGFFTGDTASGMALYDNGIGGTISCAVCHGADGLAIPPGAEPTHDDFVGLVANENPWEFLHKVRFGQPDSPMIGTFGTGATLQDINDWGAYSQMLPMEP